MHRKSGITLILALLIVSVVVAIGITISTVVIFQVRLNSVTAQSHQGYYAAESGIEQGLNRVSSLQTQKLGAALSILQNLTLPSDPNLDSTFFSASKKFLAASQDTGGTSSVAPDMQEGQSTYVDIYNVDTSLNALAQNPTLCISAVGKDVDGAGSDTIGNEVLEVSWVAWDSTGATSTPKRAYLSYSEFNQTAGCPGGQPGAVVPIVLLTPLTNYAGFRIRITALRPTGELLGVSGWGDITNLEVSTTPTTKSQILLKSISNTGGQKQALKATFPWALPLSSLFDFVIFSEQTLAKELPVSVQQNITSFGPYQITGTTGKTQPDSSSDTPFANCGSSCSYYIRLFKPVSGWPLWMTFRYDTTGQSQTQNFGSTYSASSCIIQSPYSFTGTAQFSYTIGPDSFHLPSSYQLLSQPTFLNPQESFCPTS